MSEGLGWVVTTIGTIATTWVIVLAVRAFIAPGEAQPDHPKYLILRDDR